MREALVLVVRTMRSANFLGFVVAFAACHMELEAGPAKRLQYYVGTQIGRCAAIRRKFCGFREKHGKSRAIRRK